MNPSGRDPDERPRASANESSGAIAAMGESILVGGTSGAGKSTLCAVLEARCGIPLITNERIDRVEFGGQGERTAVFRRQGELIDSLVSRGNSFSVEHTLKGRFGDRLLARVGTAGYRTTLLFLRLRDLEQAVERVASRAAAGGHSVAREQIAARLESGLRNYERLRSQCDFWFEVDNSVGYRLVDAGCGLTAGVTEDLWARSELVRAICTAAYASALSGSGSCR